MELVWVFSARAIDCVIGRVRLEIAGAEVDRCWGLQESAMEGMVDSECESEDGPSN